MEDEQLIHLFVIINALLSLWLESWMATYFVLIVAPLALVEVWLQRRENEHEEQIREGSSNG